MSKKSIPFQMPEKSKDELAASAPPTETTADQWVYQQEAPPPSSDARPAPEPQDVTSSIKITIPASPNWFGVVKIGLLLPYLTLCVWTLDATKRRLQLFAR